MNTICKEKIYRDQDLSGCGGSFWVNYLCRSRAALGGKEKLRLPKMTLLPGLMRASARTLRVARLFICKQQWGEQELIRLRWMNWVEGTKYLDDFLSLGDYFAILAGLREMPASSLHSKVQRYPNQNSDRTTVVC